MPRCSTTCGCRQRGPLLIYPPANTTDERTRLDVFRALKATGGTPEIRRQIYQLLDKLGVQHDHGVFTARAVFYIIEASLERDLTPEVGTLFESLQDILSGKVKSPQSMEHLLRESKSLMQDVGVPTPSVVTSVAGPVPAASAQTQPVSSTNTVSAGPVPVSTTQTDTVSSTSASDSSTTTPPSANVSATRRDTIHSGKKDDDSKRRYFKKPLLILGLLVPLTLATIFAHGGESIVKPSTEKQETIVKPSTEKQKTYVEAWYEKVRQPRTDFDSPRRLHDPDLFVVPPPPPTNEKLTPAHTNRQTMVNMSPYMLSCGINRPQRTPGTLPCNLQDSLQHYYGHIMRDKFQDGRIISEQDMYILMSGIADQTGNDAHDEEMKLWIEHVLRSVDPVYVPPLSRMMVHMSGTFMADQADASGEYKPMYDEVWLRDVGFTVTDNEGVSLSRRIQMLHTLIHELAHRIHLVPDVIASDKCSFLSNSPLEQYMVSVHNQQDPGPFQIGDDILTNAREEVEAVLYLGYKSDRINFEEAVWLNRKILDMRIRRAYAKAMDNDKYKDWRHEYWTKNHSEFWAEASVSFLVKNRDRAFPPRAWIEKHDPETFSILSEAWSRAQYATFDNVQPFWGTSPQSTSTYNVQYPTAQGTRAQSGKPQGFTFDFKRETK